jgi:hypothetical protein
MDGFSWKRRRRNDGKKGEIFWHTGEKIKTTGEAVSEVLPTLLPAIVKNFFSRRENFFFHIERSVGGTKRVSKKGQFPSSRGRSSKQSSD